MPTKALDPDPEFTFDAIPSENDGETGRHLAAPVRTRTSTITLLAVLAVVVGGVALYSYWPRGVTVPQPAVTIPPAPPPEPLGPRSPPSGTPWRRFRLRGSGCRRRAISYCHRWMTATLSRKTRSRRSSTATRLSGCWRRDGIDSQHRRHGRQSSAQDVAARVLPIKPVPGALATTDARAAVDRDRQSRTRYAAYVKAADAIDTGRLVGLLRSPLSAVSAGVRRARISGWIFQRSADQRHRPSAGRAGTAAAGVRVPTQGHVRIRRSRTGGALGRTEDPGEDGNRE